MPFVRGFTVMASVIVALGPQNAFLLEQGLAGRRRVFAMAVLFLGFDLLFIAIGAMGMGTLVANQPWLELGLSVLALGLFLYLGASGLRRAATGGTAAGRSSRVGGYGTAVLLTVANPGVYFDTIVIIGGMAGRHGDVADRVLFAAGAGMGSLLWFAALSGLSYYASRHVTGDRVWRVLEGGIGLVMLALAATLAGEIPAMLRGLGVIA